MTACSRRWRSASFRLASRGASSRRSGRALRRLSWNSRRRGSCTNPTSSGRGLPAIGGSCAIRRKSWRCGATLSLWPTLPARTAALASSWPRGLPAIKLACSSYWPSAECVWVDARGSTSCASSVKTVLLRPQTWWHVCAMPASTSPRTPHRRRTSPKFRHSSTSGRGRPDCRSHSCLASAPCPSAKTTMPKRCNAAAPWTNSAHAIYPSQRARHSPPRADGGSRLCPYGRSERWVSRRVRPSAVRPRPRRGHGSGGTVGCISRPATDVRAADRISACDGIWRRAWHNWGAFAGRGARHRRIGHRAGPHGGLGGAATALGRRNACGRVRNLSWLRAWRRAPTRHGCSRLFDRVRDRHGPLASCRHRPRTDGALAGRPHGRAWHRSRHRLRRSPVPVATGMRRLAGLALALPALLPIEDACAHPPFAGATGFYGGVLHPLFVPTQAIAVLSLGLLIGQQKRHLRWPMAFAYAAGLGIGFAAIISAFPPQFSTEALLAVAAIVAGLVAMARAVPWLTGCVLALGFGFTMALDYSLGGITLRAAYIV